MDIGMNIEFIVKLTPKNDKAFYSQNLPISIHLKGDLIAELVFLHKYGLMTVLPFSKYASLPLAQGNPTENYAFSWISGKQQFDYRQL